jgi:hypothetical protein
MALEALNFDDCKEYLEMLSSEYPDVDPGDLSSTVIQMLIDRIRRGRKKHDT